jgi:hypothetical protein
MAEPKIDPSHVEAYNMTRPNDTYSDVDIQHVRKGSAGVGLDALHEVSNLTHVVKMRDRNADTFASRTRLWDTRNIEKRSRWKCHKEM